MAKRWLATSGTAGCVEMINRRRFVTGLLSVPVGVAAAIHAPAVLGESIFKPLKAGLKYHSADWQRKSMILCCSTLDKAVAIHNAMKNPTNVFPVAIGQMLAGRGADLIVLDDFPSLTRRGRDWWNNSLVTRLTPDGAVVNHNTLPAQSFDFDRLSGVESVWVGTAGQKRIATRFQKPASEIRDRDIITAKAVQILYFAKKYHGFYPEFGVLVDDTSTLREAHEEEFTRWYNGRIDEEIHKRLST